jgi:hypothetical protein
LAALFTPYYTLKWAEDFLTHCMKADRSLESDAAHCE